MIRLVLLLWALPLALFWSWFGLSYYDINLGTRFLSRDMHDLVFHIYGSILGIEPAALPGMFLNACIFDTFLLSGIVAFRKRRAIAQWWRGEDRAIAATVADGPVRPAE